MSVPRWLARGRIRRIGHRIWQSVVVILEPCKGRPSMQNLEVTAPSFATSTVGRRPQARSPHLGNENPPATVAHPQVDCAKVQPGMPPYNLLGRTQQRGSPNGRATTRRWAWTCSKGSTLPSPPEGARWNSRRSPECNSNHRRCQLWTTTAHSSPPQHNAKQGNASERIRQTMRPGASGMLN